MKHLVQECSLNPPVHCEGQNNPWKEPLQVPRSSNSSVKLVKSWVLLYPRLIPPSLQLLKNSVMQASPLSHGVQVTFHTHQGQSLSSVAMCQLLAAAKLPSPTLTTAALNEYSWILAVLETDCTDQHNCLLTSALDPFSVLLLLVLVTKDWIWAKTHLIHKHVQMCYFSSESNLIFAYNRLFFWFDLPGNK